MSDLLAQIKVNHFILDLDKILSTVPVVDGYEIVQLDSQTLQVGIPGEKGFNQLFSELTRQGISVTSMKNKSNRLESLFLDLVGG
jgi:ABC-2 type transport system ATP-binding protein